MDPSKVKVRDLMNANVVRLDPGTPVDEAITMLESDRISGAPVVDPGGRVLGVLSLTDLARAKESEEVSAGANRSEYYLPAEGVDGEEDEFADKDDYSPEVMPTGTVAEWMSEDVVSVAPNDSVRVACKRMSERGIHRVLVLEEKKLVGILSSFDVVRWVANPG